MRRSRLAKRRAGTEAEVLATVATGDDPPPRPQLLLAAHPCDQCLTTRRRIVSGERAAEIVRECRREDKHFVCHKGSAAGLIVHCRGVHDRFPSLAYRFGLRIGVEIVEVDPDALEPRS